MLCHAPYMSLIWKQSAVCKVVIWTVPIGVSYSSSIQAIPSKYTQEGIMFEMRGKGCMFILDTLCRFEKGCKCKCPFKFPSVLVLWRAYYGFCWLLGCWRETWKRRLFNSSHRRKWVSQDFNAFCQRYSLITKYWISKNLRPC